MILKFADRQRNALIIEAECVKVTRTLECVHIDWVDIDGINKHDTVNADTGWTRAYLMDKGSTFDAIKHDPSLLER